MGDVGRVQRLPPAEGGGLPPRGRRPLATSAVGGDVGAGVGSHGCATSAVDTNTKDMEFYADPDDPSIYWFIVCRPDCQLNAVRHASFELEVAAMASGEMLATSSQVKTLVDAVRGLEAAWAKYFAYI